MKNNLFKSILMLGTVAVSFSACDLDEYDPNKVTGNEYLEQYEYYQGLVNKCYSPLINTFYQSSDYVALCEAGTDLWQAPQNGTSLEKYHYYTNMNADDSYVQKVWKFAYNTINTCNSVVQRAENVADATPEQITQAIAQARCLRAFYYYVLVEQFGNVTLTLDDSTLGDVDFYPTRSTVAEIYAAIIADLKYAVQNLPTSWPAEEYSRVTKKSALGLLCRAYIQGAAYDLTDEETGKSYLEMAYDTATDFIANKDTYGAYLYPHDYPGGWVDLPEVLCICARGGFAESGEVDKIVIVLRVQRIDAVIVIRGADSIVPDVVLEEIHDLRVYRSLLGILECLQEERLLLRFLPLDP